MHEQVQLVQQPGGLQLTDDADRAASTTPSSEMNRLAVIFLMMLLPRSR